MDRPGQGTASARTEDAGRAAAPLPLAVDLDGTLVRGDLLVESAVGASLQDWRTAFRIPFWLTGGKAHLKEQLGERWDFDPASLPYEPRLVDYLRDEKAAGRTIVLATGADRSIAGRIAEHLGLFDDVIASDGKQNLTGAAKATALARRFGLKGFAYAGNDKKDMAVWRAGSGAVLVNAAPALARRARAAAPVELELPRRDGTWKSLARAMRPYQWVKNLLTLVPLVCAGAYRDGAGMLAAGELFAGFCAVASAIYLLNDICDLAADRAHPSKRRRPFASGAAPILAGLALVPVLAVVGGVFGTMSGAPRALVAYAALSLAYNVKLKEMPLVDIFLLAALYSVRMFGGGEASGHPISLWLLGFSSFSFLSLALVKRVSELCRVETLQRRSAARRGYMTSDIPILEMMGCGAAFASAMVLALYVQSDTATLAFFHPKMLWGIVPLMLFWQCRLWLATARGYMHDDPIIYAARDWVSWAVLAALVALSAAAYLPVIV